MYEIDYARQLNNSLEDISMSTSDPSISVVIPIYNEEEIIPELHSRLKNAITDFPIYEIIYVNDGSYDSSLQLLENIADSDPNVSIIVFSRNYGHQAALTAGIMEARNQVVVIMDGDLQDPPELIPAMIREWEKGAEIITAVRRSRMDKGIRNSMIILFHKVFNYLSDHPSHLDSGTFCLLDQRVVEELRNLKERNRYIPGLRNWVGFQNTPLEYDRDERFSGTPKQTIRRLLKMGFDALFSFSYKPIRLASVFGLTISTFAFLYGFILFILRILNLNVVSGFTTVAVAVFFIGGIQLIFFGVLGEYIVRIYDETKNRPQYIISKRIKRKHLPKE